MEMLSDFLAHHAVYPPELFVLPPQLIVVLAGFGVLGAWLTDMAFKYSGFGMMLNFAILRIGVCIIFSHVVLTENAILTIAMAVFGGCAPLALLVAIKN